MRSRRLTICLLPGDPHALLLEGEVASFRTAALDRLGVTAREPRCYARPRRWRTRRTSLGSCSSAHGVRERLARLEAKLGVRTAADAVARALPRERVDTELDQLGDRIRTSESARARLVVILINKHTYRRVRDPT
jgi:hypothetical protein